LPVDPQVAWELHILGWAGLAVATVYFFVTTVLVQWLPKKESVVVRYEPPVGVSPATAAYLFDRGVNDKPVAVAIVNMAAKGYLRIEQKAGDYVLSRVDASIPLEDEEELVAKALFRRDGLPVQLSQLHSLARLSRQVRDLLQSTIEPDLISPHFWFFIPGLTVSLWCFLATLLPEIRLLWDSNGVAGIVIVGFVALAFLMAALRTLSALTSKVRSLLPGATPYRMRFVEGDATAPFLLLAAVAALGVIGWATSIQFGLQFAGYIIVNVLAWMALRSPTAKGRALIHQLTEFRVFLAEVDADRINRMNSPTAASAEAEKYWGWALALNVEHTWGEQFAAAILNRVGPQSAILGLESNLPEDARASAEILDLRLR
jgi:hypothetical protein